jgi:hypothetical protein
MKTTQKKLTQREQEYLSHLRRAQALLRPAINETRRPELLG